MFLNVNLQRLCKSHHLQGITSSKDSEKLEKSLCARDKAEDLCWMPGVLQTLGWLCITHRHDSVIDINEWAKEYFQKPLSVNTIHRAICRCQLKLYHLKRKPYVNMVQKCRWVSLGQGSFKMDCFKVVLWSDESKFDILVGNHGSLVLRAKEEGDIPACYQHSVQKPASLMVWGYIRDGQLACIRRHYECWKV